MATTTPQIKTDLIEMVQRNYLENKTKREKVKQAREKAREKAKELKQRNRKAKAYSRRCKIKDIVTAIIVGIVVAITISVIISCNDKESRYAIAGEDGNGMHYIYITERECKVTEVADNKVYVSYKGNEYAFYAYDTELEVGDEIICKFTDNWKIVDFK